MESLNLLPEHQLLANKWILVVKWGGSFDILVDFKHSMNAGPNQIGRVEELGLLLFY
jgi:hypothetical protein